MSEAPVGSLDSNERSGVYLRAVIGLVSAGAAFEYFFVLKRVLAPGIVALPFIDSLPRLPLSWLPAFITCWFITALLFVKRREFGYVLASFIFYTLLLDEKSYSNHGYLLGLVVLLLAAGWQRLLAFQISVVYLFSALAKLNPEYLSGDVLAAFFAVPRLPAPAYPLAAVASVVTELFVVAALWVPTLRRFGFLAALFLHLGMVLLLAPMTIVGKFQLIEFAVLMLSCYYHAIHALPRHRHVNRVLTEKAIIVQASHAELRGANVGVGPRN